MGSLNIDLNNFNLDDTNYNENEPESIIHFKHFNHTPKPKNTTEGQYVLIPPNWVNTLKSSNTQGSKMCQYPKTVLCLDNRKSIFHLFKPYLKEKCY